MKTLILTDIHANEPALRAVLDNEQNFDRLVFLGDIANFGTHPCECIELIRKYDPICVIGNHDQQIISDFPKHYWDQWAKKQLSADQADYISTFRESIILDGHILLIHGIYTVDYDILPNTSDEDIVNAFKNYLTPEIDEVWFGHYHYQIDRKIDGVTYRCIRPVGHHRDKDTRAGYSVYDGKNVIHKRIEYNLHKTIEDFKKLDIFPDARKKELFIRLLMNAYEPELLIKDIRQMDINDIKRKKSL